MARSRRTVSGVMLGLGAAALIALAGCQIKDPGGDPARGKLLFVQRCGSCHALRRAQTTGIVGPDLDVAFRQDRANGFHTDTIRGVVTDQILNPLRGGAMPANLATGQKAEDIASYVALVAARPGQDTGAVASAVPNQATGKSAVEKAGALQIDANPLGQLKYLTNKATAKAGQVTVKSQNKSQTPHDIAIRGNGVVKAGKIVSGGGVSSFTANLKPGTYKFFCTVDGHDAAGMHGVLVVK